MTEPLPASDTKHLPVLLYNLPDPHAPIILHQNSLPATATTGTTLWLSSQLLTTHLLTTLPSSLRKPLRILDLGAGCGLTSIALACAGHSVVTTDLECVVDTVLEQNVRANLPRTKNVEVRCMDWLVPDEVREDGVYDMVITADTVYMEDLVGPLVDTVVRYAGRRTEVWVALERRDEDVVRRALAAFEGTGLKGRKVKEGEGEWEGVEVWRFRWGVGQWKGARKMVDGAGA